MLYRIYNSVYIIVNNLFGSGSIKANGGNASSVGKAGGGGRIAIYGDRTGLPGVIEALGGVNPTEAVYSGGDGTVYYGL